MCFKLVVHVGESALAENITLETIANRGGYIMADCEGDHHPVTACCSGIDCIATELN